MDKKTNILLEKLSDFIRKYYLNQLLKGAFLFITFWLTFLVLVSVIEHFGRFSSAIRTVLFIVFIGFSGITFYWYIAVSLFKLFDFGKRISNKQAAKIIGKHFPNVNDKLLNTIELQDSLSQNNNALILASINQRKKELSPIPFNTAINFNENKKYAQYALVPILLMVTILIISPSVITESTSRLVQYNKHFEAPAPLIFSVDGLPNTAIQYSNVEINVKLEGGTLPEKCFIKVNESTPLKMIKVRGTERFLYTLRSIDKTTSIVFLAGGFSSKQYKITVEPKSAIKSIVTKTRHPKYTGIENEEIESQLLVSIPEGTELTWTVKTINTSSLVVANRGKKETVKVDLKGMAQLSKTIKESGKVTFYALKQDGKIGDSSTINVKIIKDKLPLISSEEFSDSVSNKLIYFKGKVIDDYGFTALNFKYKIANQKQQNINIQVPKGSKDYEYFFTWSLTKIPDTHLTAGVTIDYFFEIWDNDGINGPKVSRTQSSIFKVPSKKEIIESAEKKGREIKKDLEASIDEAKKLQNEIEKLNNKLLEKQKISWEEKKELENLLKMQKELQQKFNKIKRENEVNNFKKSEFNKNEKQILDKQKQLEELMEKVFDKKTEKILEELKKLMEKDDKKKLQEKLDELKLNSDDLEKELDRSLELFKRLEFEQKLQESIDEIKELKTAQDNLRKETEKTTENNKPEKEIEDKQGGLNKKMEELNKKLEELQKDNKKLEEPNEMPNMEEEKKKAQEEMNEAKNSLSQKKKKAATKSQQKASEELEKMTKKMESAQQKMEEQASEDIEVFRRLRQNLMHLSFDQESLIKKIQETNPRDPLYINHTKEQMRLLDNTKMIEDTLFAISKRNLNIQAMVNKEIAAINNNLTKSIRAMENRKTGQAMSRQQFVMTSINNLALLIDESIQNQQKQMSSKKFGNKSCSKPGKGKPNMSEIKKLQKKLSNQLKEMQAQQKSKGDKPGDKQGAKPGQNPKRGSKAGEQSAKMAAEQAKIREELRRLSEQLGKDGNGGNGTLKRLQDLMDKNEEDIVNFSIDKETIERQEEIMTHLLESEKAEREREFDNKRESKTTENINRTPPNILNYQKEKKKQVELLETVPLNLTPFYKNLVIEYFNKLN